MRQSETNSDQPHGSARARLRSIAGLRRFGGGDYDEFREFQRRSYGPRSYQLDPRFVEWRFLDHPYRPAEGPLIWICRREGGIVGQQTALPFPLEFRGRPIAAAWAIDLVVEPEWRLRGVAPALNRQLCDDRALVAGLGIALAARRALARAGWLDLGRVQRYVRLLRPLQAGQAPAGRKPVTRKVALASRFGVPLLTLMAGIDSAMLAIARLAGLHLEPVSRFDSRVDAVWSATAAEYELISRRDLTALAWRFDAAPDADLYQRHYLMRRGVVVGYVVLRRRQDCMMVVDHLCPARWRWALFAFCLKAARRDHASTLHCLATPRAVRTGLMRLGFLPRPGPHFMVHASADAGLPPELVGNPDNWFITEADSDLDHTPTP